MTVVLAAVAIQAAPEVAVQLERLLWAQAITAVATAVLAVVAVGGAVLGYSTLRRLAHLLDSADHMVNQIGPHAAPFVERAERLADDAASLMASAREEYRQLEGTLKRANDGLREAVADAEARVRRFGAVVDLVQTETEDALVDAASTARGLQATARALRGEPVAPAPMVRVTVRDDSGGIDG
jgi:hypothetical protein